MPLLAIDVGAGTQDILLYQEDISLEGSTKMILPSQTAIVAGRIDDARKRMHDIFLEGPTMGGGASTSAVMRHLAAGMKVYATPTAAATINDNLERVEKLGIIIQEEAPASAEVIKTGDIDIPALCKAFELFNIHLPREIAVAVQDHGYSPNRSNRLVRFEHMANAIASGGTIEAFAYRQPPENMTRMLAVKDDLEKLGLSASFDGYWACCNLRSSHGFTLHRACSYNQLRQWSYCCRYFGRSAGLYLCSSTILHNYLLKSSRPTWISSAREI